MSGTVFVDTNVLVYVRDLTDEEKQRRAAEWLTLLWKARVGRLSVQVLQEYYAVMTRKLDPPRRFEEVREDVMALMAWSPTEVDSGLIERAWGIEDRFPLSWWDALIVAAALASRCRYLLSEDFQDGQVIDGLTIVNPFTHEPSVLIGGFR
jgi:predicted nucleic acid-binding protein